MDNMKSRGKGRRTVPCRTPSSSSTRRSSTSQASQVGRISSSSTVCPARSSPIFSTPVHSRQDLNKTLGRSSSIIRHRRPASVVSRSSPALPPYPQSHSGPLSFPSWSSGTPSLPPISPYEVGHNLFDSSDTPGDNEEADVLNEVIMAIDMRENGTVGCAYYVVMDEALFLQEDIQMAGIELVETLIVYVEPTTVIVSNRSTDELVEFLESRAQNFVGHNEGDGRGAYILRALGSSEFNYENAKKHLLNLNLDSLSPPKIHFNTVVEDEADDGIGGEMIDHRQGKLMRLATWINLDSQFSIGCAGAVLSDVQRRKAAGFLPNDPDARFAFRVRSIEMFTLASSMFVNADALASLQILGSENHPNFMNQGPDKSKSGAKEGLSVYGLFHLLAHTVQGKAKLRQMFLRPSVNLDLIYERQRTISALLRPENSADVDSIGKWLRKVKNIKKSLVQLRKGSCLSPAEAMIERGTWATLQAFSAYTMEIREAVRKLSGAGNLDITTRMVDGISQRSLVAVGELIAQTIDFQKTKEARRTCVMQGIDPDLDELKRNYDGLEHFLNEVAAHMIQEVPEWARQYVKNCIFYPQIGFLTVVGYNPETGRGNYEGEGVANDVWERMFVIDNDIYYKNRRMKELDGQYGDLYCMIVDKEIEIVHKLGMQILEHEEALLEASDLCGEFDSLLALALGADKYKFTAPHMTTSNIIHIQGGRHPLQELVVPSFISNDTFLLGGPSNVPEDNESTLDATLDELPSVLVMTGPNHSGKSVYLKQVALIVFLAHIGSFVPAEQAYIGLTDRLLTRIATRESVSRNESAFAIDLKQAAFSMNFATRRSLILIDEFGKGTNTMDGAGLVTALLDHFLSLGGEAPKLLAATHFHEIFENDYLPASPKLAFAHMDVRIDLDAESVEDQVAYLYSLASGRSTSSFGSRCAAMNGVDPAVVERSEALVLLLARGEDLRATCARLSDREIEKLDEAELVAREFLEMDINLPPQEGKYVTKQGDDSTSIWNRLRDILNGSSSIST